ncbi:hydrogenase formation protein HypD [Aminipila butyrica]|uniref:Hydrogenase formation protein HypD n=1 Tax=Aminipila butyrica TaxID=433296 RepID=A0A858BVV1_9FIRM|nr:hydrogenase formation protein HypD [Aminipila butyrica]QIB69228.1 hydrogenase formation protein HypD [Aminipila butyrica]
MVTLEQIVKELKEYDGEEIKIMEVCGTHTSSIFKNGIRSLISPKIKLISGPGCPVCVTPSVYVDKLVELSLKPSHCVLTFGDMMKVKGNQGSLTEAVAKGGRVRVLYSPLDSLTAAQEDPDTQYVFAAVGFETTTPIYGLLLDEILKKNLSNLKLLTSLKTITPALEYICENEKGIDAFIAPGHVSVIIGSQSYEALAEKYGKPFVVAGFGGEHILAAIYEILLQLRDGRHQVKNMYVSAVSQEGNPQALSVINQYFETKEDFWRGIGVIPQSSLGLKSAYQQFDAGSSFIEYREELPKGCRCTDVILGRITPVECPLFGGSCTPLNAVGPCMVSTEGVCGIWYKNRG